MAFALFQSDEDRSAQKILHCRLSSITYTCRATKNDWALLPTDRFSLEAIGLVHGWESLEICGQLWPLVRLHVMVVAAHEREQSAIFGSRRIDFLPAGPNVKVDDPDDMKANRICIDDLIGVFWRSHRSSEPVPVERHLDRVTGGTTNGCYEEAQAFNGSIRRA